METKRIEDIYQKIANKLNEIIPDKWTNAYLYAEVLNGSTEVYFYYKSLSNELIYSHDIPSVYNVSKEIYRNLLFELFDYFEELHEEFKNIHPEPWTNLTFCLESSGKFHIDFNYDDVLKNKLLPLQQQMLWKYKVLGIYPTDEDDRKLVVEYIKNSENKPKQ